MQFLRYDMSSFMFSQKVFRMFVYCVERDHTNTSSGRLLYVYSQLLPCGHLAITDTPIIRTVAKSLAKTNYRRLTETNSRYYGLSLVRTLTRGPLQCPQ